MPVSKDFFKFFSGDVWIETGTYMGDGVSYALDAQYKKLISIELSEDLANQSMKRFEKEKRVKIHNGKAHVLLPDILDQIKNEHVVFWLDAHYSACGTAGEDDPQPLMKELAVIKSWSEKTNLIPTILIDDMRTFTYESCGFSEKEITEILFSICNQYQIEKLDGYQEHTGTIFSKDVIVAKTNSQILV